jgi:glycerate 2-kinase
MRILIAPDKFKGSLSAQCAAVAIARGFTKVFPDAEIKLLPLADGGEGMLDAFKQTSSHISHQVIVQDAIGRDVTAEWIMLNNHSERHAIIESSQANGLWRIESINRNPLLSSSFGVGQMIVQAVSLGASKITVGLGGSATNDAGLGLGSALGICFHDDSRNRISVVPNNFLKISDIDSSDKIQLPPIYAACDVNNPLLGENGATYTYGPQKGLLKHQLAIAETALAHAATIADRHFHTNFQTCLGAGAAGGLGYGLMTFCSAKLVPGFECISHALDAERHIQLADLIITGEGSLDSQSLNGKTPVGVSRIARKYNKPIMAVAGRVSDEELLLRHFDIIEKIMTGNICEVEALNDADRLLEKTAIRLAEKFRSLSQA